MKYIFFIFSAIGWLLLPPSISYAQIQIDSVRVEMKDIEVLYCYHNNGGGGGPKFAVDTCYNTLQNIAWTAPIFNQSNTSDSFALDFYGFPFGGLKKIRLIYDSLTNQLISFQYDYVFASLQDANDSESFRLTNTALISFDSTLEINLDRQGLVSQNFTYHKVRFGMYSGGGRIQETYTYSSTITSSHLSIVFYKHIPVSSVNSQLTEENRIQVFPNPSSKTLSVVLVGPNSKTSIDVFDILGGKLFSNEYIKSDSPCDVDVSSLPSGIYYLRAGNQMQKFVIHR